MKASLLRFCFVLCALLVVAVSAWTKEDHEIFRLNDELQQAEGHNVTFYDYLGVNRTSKHADIIKAYRKKSRSMHPDKAKRAFIAQKAGQAGKTVATHPPKRELDRAVKLATQRYARLAVVRDVLTGPGRARYDHFLRNGFPRWKGSGYYYSRFRPGLGSVLLGLYVVFAGVAHYAALALGHSRQRRFLQQCIRHARRSAWGDEMGIGALAGLGAGTPSPDAAAAATASESETSGPGPALTRRQRRMMEKESRKEAKRGTGSSSRDADSPEQQAPADIPTTVPGTHGERRRVELPNGVPVIVDAMGDVYLEETDEHGNAWEELLDPDAVPRPRFRDTAMFTLPGRLLRRVRGRFVPAPERVVGEDEDLRQDEVADEVADEQRSAQAALGEVDATPARSVAGKRRPNRRR
ncbi:hypothetical protein KEM52_004748 [Ascosphaera acerosa]|nr:hypothetical protein KEM52_004748 [Ascosphaera acerosa]